jgi:hypothetical protein
MKMDQFLTLLTSLGGVLAGALFLYLGNRYVANKSTEVGRAQVEVENRKVDQASFEQFTRTYEKELQKLQKQIDQTTKWLVISLRHIRQLRSDVLTNRELTKFPDELRNIPFWLLGSENDDPISSPDQQHPDSN